MDSWVLVLLILAATLLYFWFRSSPNSPVTIRNITVYPVKSCAGISLRECKVTATGLYLDRNWIIVDREGQMVTARQDPRLWRIIPQIDLSGKTEPRELVLAYEQQRVVLDLTKPLGEKIVVEVFNEKAEVADVGVEAEQWFQSALGKDYRLFRLVTPRPHTSGETSAPTGTTVTLTDLMQVLVASEASFNTLVEATPMPKKQQLNMSCFRPNIVVAGVGPFAEDSWKEVRINGLKFLGVAPCPRCRMTTIDPNTLAFDEKTEPLPTLRKIHGDGKGLKGYFGQWLVRTANGVISVGDQVHVLSRKTFPN